MNSKFVGVNSNVIHRDVAMFPGAYPVQDPTSITPVLLGDYKPWIRPSPCLEGGMMRVTDATTRQGRPTHCNVPRIRDGGDGHTRQTHPTRGASLLLTLCGIPSGLRPNTQTTFRGSSISLSSSGDICVTPAWPWAHSKR